MKQAAKTIDELKSIVDPLIAENDKYVIEIQELPDNKGFTVHWQEQKTYTALDGKEYPDEAWITKEGEMLQVQDIPLPHLQNILRMILRNSREAEIARRELRAHIAQLVGGMEGGIGSLIMGEDDSDDEDDITPPSKPHTLH